MIRVALTCAAIGCAVLSACANTVAGTPVAGQGVIAGSAAPSSSARPIPGPPAVVEAGEQPGVVPTAAPAPAGATCAPDEPPPVGVTASIDDPAAPKITVALPTGWSTSAGDGDVGARLTGPDGETATVTIRRTPLDPGAAFEQYADDALGASTVSSVSVLPGDLCGYSGQKLLGSWSESPQRAVTFGDRIAHIPTGETAYLVAVHVEAPVRTSDFDPLTSPLLDDFSVAIPS
ncbi:hypothetical protein SAMN04489835_5862 [Mycolicibacterium rutilum]|uniref:Lipoprotein LpqN n=1 Tax=Mycolicibacterium rutilum TaxID=370526 RepID=A0A1H6M328_MYCRU|nr:hypothetical protein [Mycolicibacterium rutilum]SEH93243.1 hypothetical protein SAMN04489835_5862 [Mycolicibacterium rutilum]